MAKQFAFHQLGGERGAVDGHTGLACALAPAMNGPGQFALAGTGFTQNENVGIGAGDLACGFQHHHHRRAVRVEPVLGFVYFAFQRFQSSRQLAHFQLLGRRQAQLIGAAGLYQIVRCTGLYSVDRSVDRGMGGNDDDAHPGGLDAHLCQHIQAVVLTQAQIEEAQVEDLALQQGFSLCRAIGGRHAVALVLQAVAEGSQDGRFIVDQQDTTLMFLG
ncbi:hypothetical protein D3C77_304880 [compost metagenome]